MNIHVSALVVREQFKAHLGIETTGNKKFELEISEDNNQTYQHQSYGHNPHPKPRPVYVVNTANQSTD